MTLTPENAERIQSIETRLATLDPTLRDFCARHDYTFSSPVGVWPRKRAWRREEVDRCFDLTMDLTVREAMERGFYPDMPWSLYITASTRPPHPDEVRFLTADVFRQLPFSSLCDRLGADLEIGLTTLTTFTLETINERGQKLGHAT
jgi:hypothetical protein